MKIKSQATIKMNILLINRGAVTSDLADNFSDFLVCINTHLAASFCLENKAQLILKLSFFVSILVLALVFLRKCNHGLQHFLTVVINKSVSKATQKNGYKFERKY